MAITPGRIALISQNPPAPPAPTFTAGPVLVKNTARRKQWLPSNPQIDWSHPLAQGIVNCVASRGSSMQRLDTSAIPARQGNYRTGFSPYGVATRSEPTVEENPGFTFTHQRSLEGVPYTSLVVANGGGGNGQLMLVRLLVTGGYGSSNVGWRSEVGQNIRYQASVANFGGLTLDSSVGLNDWFVGSMSWRSSEFLLYMNGIRASSSTNAVLSSAGTGMQILHSGNAHDGVSHPGSVVFVCFWDRTLTHNEHALLAADPFCFLRSSSPQMFVNSAVPLFSNFKGWGIPL